MHIIELFLIAVGLSMDAFAVAVCAGLAMPKVTLKKALIVGLYFGFFQAAMPLIGYFIATLFADKILAYDHWIVFGLLVFLGGKMIFDSIKEKKAGEEENAKEEASLHIATMLPLAIATSVDAMAVGVSFAFLEVNIVPAVLFIGAITLVLSMLGVKIGNIFGAKFKEQAGIAGGVILILMGIEILLDELGIFQLF
jgi:putative Mn2+ efflux pump MntP